MCLSNSPKWKTSFSAQRYLENAKKGLIVIDCTTADPTSTTRIADAMAEKGMHFIDAPWAAPKEAAEGTLDAMIGAVMHCLNGSSRLLNAGLATLSMWVLLADIR